MHKTKQRTRVIRGYRRSGKSTKLIDAVLKTIRTQDAIIVVPHPTMAENLVDIIKQRYTGQFIVRKRLGACAVEFPAHETNIHFAYGGKFSKPQIIAYMLPQSQIKRLPVFVEESKYCDPRVLEMYERNPYYYIHTKVVCKGTPKS